MTEHMVFLLPLIAALIGWTTNRLAVKMLFRPRREIRILGLRIQGVFPKRQAVLAEKMGELVARELFDLPEVTAKLREMAASEEIVGMISDRIEKSIREKLIDYIPMARMFLSDEIVAKVKELFLKDLKEMLEEATETIVTGLEGSIDVRAKVREKVAGFSAEKLEDILNAVMQREFRFIEWVGAVLGFLIGIVQLLLTQPF